MVKDPTDTRTRNMWINTPCSTTINLEGSMGLYSDWSRLPMKTRPPYWDWLHERNKMITIELSEVTNNKEEDAGKHIAKAEGITVRGFNGVICPLARKLVNAGHDPDTPVIVKRRDQIVFDEQPLWRWAVLDVEDRGDGTRLVLLSFNKTRSTANNDLIARARERGPALLAALHRDRQGLAVAPRGYPDAEA